MYSPKIREDLVRRLYELKQSNPNKKKLTSMVNEAVELYLRQMDKKKLKHSK